MDHRNLDGHLRNFANELKEFNSDFSDINSAVHNWLQQRVKTVKILTIVLKELNAIRGGKSLSQAVDSSSVRNASLSGAVSSCFEPAVLCQEAVKSIFQNEISLMTGSFPQHQTFSQATDSSNGLRPRPSTANSSIRQNKDTLEYGSIPQNPILPQAIDSSNPTNAYSILNAVTAVCGYAQTNCMAAATHVSSCGNKFLDSCGFTNPSVVAFRRLLSSGLLDEAKDVLEKDEELFQLVNARLQHTRSLYESLRQVLGFSILPNPKEVLVILLEFASSADKLFNCQVVEDMRENTTFKKLRPSVQQRLLQLMANVVEHKELSDAIANINAATTTPRSVDVLKLILEYFKDYYSEVPFDYFTSVVFLDPKASEKDYTHVKYHLFNATAIAMRSIDLMSELKCYEKEASSKYPALFRELLKLMANEVEQVKSFLPACSAQNGNTFDQASMAQRRI